MDQKAPPPTDHLTLWKRNKGMADALVRDFVFSARHLEDARQEALLALWEASLSWQEGVHSSFEHYAYYVMRGKLFRYLTEKAEDKPKLSRQERQAVKELRDLLVSGEMLTCATISKLSSESGITPFRFGQIICYWYASHCQITVNAMEIIDDQSGDEPNYFLDEREEMLLSDAIASLGQRDRLIIASRFLEDPKKTLSELSKVLGISIERVRVLENKALGKLKRDLSEKLSV